MAKAQGMAEHEPAGRTAADGCTASIGQMTIRPMTEADVREVAALEAETFSMPWSKKSLMETLCQEEMLFLVAREKALLGYAGVCMSLDEGEITNVAVRENARRRGVARRLLEELTARMAEANICRLVLEVRVSNTAAMKLYESCGFAIAGTRKRFYERPVEDAWVMSKSI